MINWLHLVFSLKMTYCSIFLLYSLYSVTTVTKMLLVQPLQHILYISTNLDAPLEQWFSNILKSWATLFQSSPVVKMFYWPTIIKITINILPVSNNSSMRHRQSAIGKNGKIIYSNMAAITTILNMLLNYPYIY